LIKKKFIIFAVLFVILIVSPIILNQFYKFLLEPVSKQESPQIFVVKPGQPVAQIAQNLAKAGLIKNAFAFRLLVSQMGISKNIQYGDFRLSANLSSREIAKELTHGAIDIWITLPEGMRIEEQAARLEEKLKLGSNEKYQFDKSAYIKLAQEGYMFPDTYLIAKDAASTDVAQRLRQTFDEKVGQLLAKGQANNLTKEEVIILASLVERESKSSQERPIIAGILLNRLNAGMALQVDATVQYAKGYDSNENTWWPQISTADYQTVKSRFNTYLYPGLPPAPIANPGLESLQAATEPAQTDYFYYLHDTDGKIHYATTAEEHNQNIQNYL